MSETVRVHLIDPWHGPDYYVNLPARVAEYDEIPAFPMEPTGSGQALVEGEPTGSYRYSVSEPDGTRIYRWEPFRDLGPEVGG